MALYVVTTSDGLSDDDDRWSDAFDVIAEHGERDGYKTLIETKGDTLRALRIIADLTEDDYRRDIEPAQDGLFSNHGKGGDVIIYTAGTWGPAV